MKKILLALLLSGTVSVFGQSKIDVKKEFDFAAKQYEGKYFKEIDDTYTEHIKCLFVYSTDKENCNPMALSIYYWENNNTSHFGIAYEYQFNPKKWGDGDKWKEISYEEYIQHYNEVQSRIQTTTPIKKVPVPKLPSWMLEQWKEIYDTEYNKILKKSLKLKPVSEASSFHITEHKYIIDGDKYRFSYAIGDYENPTIEKLIKA